MEKLLSQKHSLNVLRVIYTTRFIDEKMNNLVKQNKGTSFFLTAKGHEIVGAVASSVLEEGKDFALPYYRDRAFAIGFNCPIKEIFAAFLARDIENHSGGRMMLDHFSDKAKKIPCQSSVVGSQFLQAAGLAKGIKLRKGDEVVYVSAGEGATSQGDFHEALNFSCIHQLPVIFVIQDNGWAISTPSHQQTAGGCISQIVKGYKNLNVFITDGNYEELAKAFKSAYEKAKESSPSVIVAKVPRLGPHTISDDSKKYRDDALEFKRDPLPIFEKWLLDKNYISLKEMEELKSTIKEEVEKAALEAEKLPFPEKETSASFVFKDFSVEEQNSKSSSTEIVIMDAINKALEEEMARDKNVLVFGQDVAHGKGGVFGITRNLSEKFPDRCFNTPLAESTIIGIAIGLSFDGYRPVAEIQFADYCWTGMNQIVNELSSIYYRSKGQWNCPVVIRLPYGGYIQGGPYHSQSIEALFTHVPGLKVVVPSNAFDAKRLLKTAIRDPNPVIFLEHKALYRQRVFCARPEPSSDELLPFGKANVVKEGSDLTLIAWGMMVVMANEVAEDLKKQNISVELIDLRTLNPLDMDTILTSLKKTGKVLVVHEACKTGGFGAELSARITEEAFSYLDAPVLRLGAKDCPVPYCKDLENEVLPQKENIRQKVLELFSY